MLRNLRNNINVLIVVFTGLAFWGVVGGIIFLTHETLTYAGNDLAQAGILIGILGSLGTGIIGLFGGIALGRHMAAGEKADETPPALDSPQPERPSPVARGR